MSRSRTRWWPALGALGLAAVSHNTAIAADFERAPSAAPTNGNDARNTDEGKRAVERAKQALEEQHLWIDGLTVESVTEQQFTDSSLGCRRPGVSYMQAMSSGYAVKLASKNARREVHVSGDHAAICTGFSVSGTPHTLDRPPQVPLRKLDEMTEAARKDLAARIGATPESVTMVTWQPLRLPLRVLRCEVPKDPSASPVPGYKFILNHEGRLFTYQSDLESVFACPRIERE
jgi:hypothetical protein